MQRAWYFGISGWNRRRASHPCPLRRAQDLGSGPGKLELRANGAKVQWVVVGRWVLGIYGGRGLCGREDLVVRGCVGDVGLGRLRVGGGMRACLYQIVNV